MQHDITAQSIMSHFANDTGLSNTLNKPRRYLWTDAFAVCNYLTFYRQTGEPSFLQQAITLVDQVHRILGQHRRDSVHSGWISGLSEEQAQLHPTRGGLRIGKKRDERKVNEPADDMLEWEQDGQYFHYLTKWMHALNCVSRATGKTIYNQWAMELARIAHSKFVYTSSADGTKRMYWKMSIDLSRPLVTSMGQHDPLDGLITYRQLQATAEHYAGVQTETSAELILKTQIEDMFAMGVGCNWVSNDALGIGGLLSDAYRLLQIDSRPLLETTSVEDLLQDIEYSLRAFFTYSPLNRPAEYRLGFRELGLAIGLQAIDKMQQYIECHPEHFHHLNRLDSLLKNLMVFYPIHKIIEDFWLEPGNQSVSSWQENIDINNVMLATSLAPDRYLQL